MKGMKALLRKILNSWTGMVLFIVAGVFITYYFTKTINVIPYAIIVIGIPLIYHLKKQDVLPYVYGGVVLAFLVHGLLAIVLSTNLPVVAVVSSSMQHDNAEINHYEWLEKNLGYNKSYVNSWPFPDGFSIGDMPIVRGSDSYKVGEIIVYDANQAAPIIHRIIKINQDGTYQTKGDNNPNQNKYEFSVKKEQIRGKVIFIIPKIGYLKVFANRILGV